MTIYSPVLELFYNSTWNVVPMYTRDPITISRGTTPESTTTPPQTASFTIDNRSGLYHPKNPLSPLFDTGGRNTPCRITLDADVRFYGEVSKWTPGSSIEPVSGDRGDAWVKVTAAGQKRRLAQGKYEAKSAFYRWMAANAVHYWPLGFSNMNDATGGTVPFVQEFVTYGGGAIGAGDLGTSIEAGLTLSSKSSVRTRSLIGYQVALSGYYAVAWVARMGQVNPAVINTGDSVWGMLALDNQAASTIQIEVTGNPGGHLRVNCLGTTTYITDERLRTVEPLLFWATVTNSGANANWTVSAAGLGQLGSGTTTSKNLAAFAGGIFMHNAGLANPSQNAVVGHVGVFTNSAQHVDLEDAYFGFPGESARTRFTRMCTEAGITAYEASMHAGAESPAMGAQYAGTFLSQLDEIEALDDALVVDLRTGPGLVLINGASQWAGAVALTLDYAQGHVGPPSVPVLDDLGVRNDITLQRRDGGLFHVEKTAGPLNTSDPSVDPLGIGRVADSPTINPQDDGQLAGLAYWELHLSTVDKMRWPSVTVDYTANPSLAVVDIPYRIKIVNIPLHVAPYDADLIVVGYTETITAATRRITYFCKPYEPYKVGVYGTDPNGVVSRYDGDLSTTNGSFSAGVGTSLSVATAGGPLWSTTTTFPFDIQASGVVLRVTAISGASSPQTFTVQATTVNGINKTIASGSKVSLAEPSFYGR